MKNETTSGSIGFGGLLTIVFIVLKLTGYIDWSWWWVTAPLWIQVAFAVAFAVLCGIISLISKLFK